MSEIVVDNPGESRFELRVDDELVGWSEYLPAVGRDAPVARGVAGAATPDTASRSWSRTRFPEIEA